MVWVLEKATFIALGGDVLDTPVVRIDRPAGHVRQIEVSGGTQPFPDDYIVEVHVTDFHVTDHGGQRGSDAPVRDEPARGALACLGIRVFACDEDYISDIPRYEYRPTRPEPNASLHGPVNRRADGPADGIGVEFMCFPATALVSQDGGPDLNSVFVAPGQDIAHARKAVFYGSDQPADQSGRRAWQGDRPSAAMIRTAPSQPAPPATVCFAGGTQILTDQGPVAVEHLQIGDRVWTLDNGYRPVLWMDQTTLSADDLEAHPHLRPVLLPRSVFRGDADLLVSRRHLILSAQDRLHRAQDLLERPDLNARLVSDGRDVTYFHLLLDRHQIVSANGVLSESFYPSTRALQSLSSPARDRLSQILPWTCAPSWYDPAAPLANYGPTARPEAQPTDPFTPVTRAADSSAA